MIDGMENVKACRVPDRQVSELLRLLESQMPNMGKLLRAHIKALNEELMQALRGHEPRPKDPIEEGICTSMRGKE